MKQSVITEAVTKGIRGNRPMKDSGIEWLCDIPVEWNIKRLKTMFGFGKGLPITKEKNGIHSLPLFLIFFHKYPVVMLQKVYTSFII